MKVIGFDMESHLISPGCLAPRMVCLSWAKPFTSTGLLNRVDGLAQLRQWLLDPEVILIAHNAPFDLGVACAEDPSFVPLVFDALRDHRIRCTLVRQKLLDVALGMRKFRHTADGRASRSSYGLADLVALYFDEHLEKADTWRLRYALLDGVPVEEWPAEARDYAIGDSVQALRVYAAQDAEVRDSLEIDELPDQLPQQRAAFALHLMSAWGIRAEASRVDHFVAHCEEEIEKMHRALSYCLHCGQPRETHEEEGCETFENTGIFKPDGSRTMAEIRRRVVESLERQGLPVPYTDPSDRFPDGQVQIDKDALLLTDDPHLHVLAESMTFAKHLSQWAPVLRAAVERPVCARYEVLVETGRTSCGGSEGQEGSNWQNPPRRGEVRPAIVPRAGYVFGFADADTVELRAHAQNCLDLPGVGYSKMADALVAQAKSHGPDLHEVLAASIMGVDPHDVQAGIVAGDKVAEAARQFAKIPNFGFPGGLGAPTFVAYAAGQLDRAEFLNWFHADRETAVAKAKRYRESWFEAWPENRDYFRVVGDMIDRERGEGTIQQLMSGRIRGRVRFCAAANGFFQGRVADAMKEVLWRLADECYTGRCTTEHHHGGSGRCTVSGRSILYGSRPVLFLHDESGLEHPENGSESDRVERQADINVECLQRWLPDIPCTSSGVLVRRWAKGSKQLRVDGKIVPVRPEKDATGKTKWVHDALHTKETRQCASV